MRNTHAAFVVFTVSTPGAADPFKGEGLFHLSSCHLLEGLGQSFMPLEEGIQLGLMFFLSPGFLLLERGIFLHILKRTQHSEENLVQHARGIVRENISILFTFP